MNRDFKGFFVSKNDIDTYGFKEAILINAYKNGAPGLKKYQIRRIKKKLNLHLLSPEQIKAHILANKGSYTCDWCKCNTHVIHSHHYPIQRKDGGAKIVSICPNCYSAYHSLKC